LAFPFILYICTGVDTHSKIGGEPDFLGMSRVFSWNNNTNAWAYGKGYTVTVKPRSVPGPLSSASACFPAHSLAHDRASRTFLDLPT
jgi:hypothetical protein